MPFEELKTINYRLNQSRKSTEDIAVDKKYTIQDLIRAATLYLSDADNPNVSKEFHFPDEPTIEREIFSFFDDPVILEYIREKGNQHYFADACRREMLEGINEAGFVFDGNDKGNKSLEFRKDADGSILVIERVELPKTVIDMRSENGSAQTHSSEESIATSTLVTRILKKDGVITHEIESFEITPGKSEKSKEICGMLFSTPQLEKLRKYVVGTKEYKAEQADLMITSAVLKRGSSFISAAKLIVENSADKINALNSEVFPLRQLLMGMKELPPGYLAKIQQKTNVELMKDYLEMLDKHWRSRPVSGVPPTLNTVDLAALEKELIETIRQNIYPGAGKKFKVVKEELDDAENHVCWKVRQEKTCTVGGARAEKPIAFFTTEQTQEWMSILKSGNNRPKWFTSLPAWEQQYLRNKVYGWNNNKIKTKNLGEFLGSVPTTIRRYPGAANAYTTTHEVTGDNSVQTFYKVRTGYLVPFDIKDKKEKVRIAKQNIKQLLAVSITDYIKAERKRLGKTETDAITISMPLLIQTLQSAPFQPSGADNKALFKAIDEVRGELALPWYKEDKKGFFTKLGVIIPRNVTIAKIDVIDSNRPVNSVRGISWLVSRFGRQSSDNNEVTRVLSQHLAERETETPDNPGIKMARAALDAFKAQSYVGNTFSWRNIACKIPFIKRFVVPPIANAMAERAALEQIIASQTGIRMGSCVSGKDREEMVTEMALAMTEFYGKHGEMPPNAGSKGRNSKQEDLKALRKEFIASVANHFLSEHGQKLAGENAAGCNGLKNVEDVFCRDICHEIREQASIRTPGGPDPITITDGIAGINKLATGKLKKANLDIIRTSFSPQVVIDQVREAILLQNTTSVGSNLGDDTLPGSTVTVANTVVTQEERAALLAREPSASSVTGHVIATGMQWQYRYQDNLQDNPVVETTEKVYSPNKIQPS